MPRERLTFGFAVPPRKNRAKRESVSLPLPRRAERDLFPRDSISDCDSLKKQYSGSLRLIWCNASDLITLFAFRPPDRTSIPQCTSTFTTPLPPPPFLHLYYSRPGMAASRVRSVEREGRFAGCRVGARGWWCCSTGSGRGPVGARGEEGWVGCFERVSTCEWGSGFAVWVTDVPVES
jgi:hypothetical protein